MTRPRFWTCPKCKSRWPRLYGVCQTEACTGRRPRKQTPKHQEVLDLMPYEEWVELYGELCGICGRPPGPNRRLDRDHDHRTGEPRGLLCHKCNRALPEWITVEWLQKAIAYLTRRIT